MESSEKRFINIKKIGTQKKWVQDLYHSLLVSSWKQFFLAFVSLFLLFNSIFALFYCSQPNSLSGTDNSFWHAFAFSVQTFSTVGYGVFAPYTNYSHVVVIIESMLSVFVTALLTGLIFSKFARPSARILFTKNLLVNNFDGKRVLTFRMGNLRANQIAEAQVRMMILKSFVSLEGQSLRRQVDLNLMRSSSLFFGLTWTVIHVIDESSPIYNMSLKDLIDQNIEFGVAVTGYDSSFSQNIHASAIYPPEDVIFDKYFEDVFEMENGKITRLNYNKFHNLKK